MSGSPWWLGLRLGLGCGGWTQGLLSWGEATFAQWFPAKAANRTAGGASKPCQGLDCTVRDLSGMGSPGLF